MTFTFFWFVAHVFSNTAFHVIVIGLLLHRRRKDFKSGGAQYSGSNYFGAKHRKNFLVPPTFQLCPPSFCLALPGYSSHVGSLIAQNGMKNSGKSHIFICAPVPTINQKWGARAPLCPMVSAPMYCYPPCYLHAQPCISQLPIPFVVFVPTKLLYLDQPATGCRLYCILPPEIFWYHAQTLYWYLHSNQ